MEPSWGGLNYEWNFQHTVEVLNKLERYSLLWRDHNYIHQTNMMVSVDKKRLVWLTVENKFVSCCISHEITAIWYIINILSCNIPIGDVDYHTPYFDIFVWRYYSMPYKVSNISTQFILISAGEPYVILICKTPKFFLVAWVHQNSSRDIRKCLIMNFTFTNERICITRCSLHYDVHVVECLHKFRRSC